MIEFAQPLALWTGLLVGLPILAHLAYRRIAHKIPFSTLRFLRTSTIPRSGRKKPSDLMLLLLRVLFFGCLTLILADPYWQESSPVDLNPLGDSECLFWVDTTPSMTGWGGWEEAISSIQSKITEEKNVRYGLLASQGGSLVALPTGSAKEDLESALKQLSSQSSAGSLQSILDQVPPLFSPKNTAKKIMVVSDFQKSSWQEVAGRFSALGIEVELLPVGHGDSPWQTRTGNRAIVDSRVASGGEDKIRIWAALRNWDDASVDLNVSLIAGGQARQTVLANLPPLGSTQIQFTLPSKDFAQATIRLDGEDAYARDNNQSLWVLPPLPRAFGFWHRSEEDPTDLLEQQFLQAAMESTGDGEWNTWVENNQRASDLKKDDSSKPLDFLMVLGLSGWFEDDGLAPVLSNYLNNGGKVLVTPPNDSHVRMNRALKDGEIIDFTFAGINRTAFRMEPYRIDVLEKNSRLHSVFSGDSVRDLYLTEIRQFITLNDPLGLDVPLRDRTGRPLVLVRSFPGGGKLVFSSFRMVPQWTDLPMRNSFLPLIAELCGVREREQKNGGVLRVDAGLSNGEQPSASLSSTYGLLQQGDQRIEVVHPLVESFPEVMDPEDVIDALAGSHLSSDSLQGANGDLVSEHPQSLWQWFALAAFLLLLLETMCSVPSFLNRQTPEVQNA